MAEIFVFGSNLAGRHGKGAALHAKRFCGAIYGRGVGLQGNSYAIPTKGHRLEVLPLYVIGSYVREFKRFAESRPDLTFKLTPIGCGLAGYLHSEIGPMFEGAPGNVVIPPEFAPYATRTNGYENG
jgi:hypothetical protein